MLIIFLIAFENQCASTKLVPVEFVDLSTSIKIITRTGEKQKQLLNYTNIFEHFTSS